jgi:hypothetical protein
MYLFLQCTYRIDMPIPIYGKLYKVNEDKMPLTFEFHFRIEIRSQRKLMLYVNAQLSFSINDVSLLLY